MAVVKHGYETAVQTASQRMMGDVYLRGKTYCTTLLTLLHARQLAKNSINIDVLHRAVLKFITSRVAVLP